MQKRMKKEDAQSEGKNDKNENEEDKSFYINEKIPRKRKNYTYDIIEKIYNKNSKKNKNENFRYNSYLLFSFYFKLFEFWNFFYIKIIKVLMNALNLLWIVYY